MQQIYFYEQQSSELPQHPSLQQVLLQSPVLQPSLQQPSAQQVNLQHFFSLLAFLFIINIFKLILIYCIQDEYQLKKYIFYKNFLIFIATRGKRINSYLKMLQIKINFRLKWTNIIIWICQVLQHYIFCYMFQFCGYLFILFIG